MIDPFRATVDDHGDTCTCGSRLDTLRAAIEGTDAPPPCAVHAGDELSRHRIEKQRRDAALDAAEIEARAQVIYDHFAPPSAPPEQQSIRQVVAGALAAATNNPDHPDGDAAA